MNQVFYNKIWVDENEQVDIEYSAQYQHLLDVHQQVEQIIESARPLFKRDAPLTIEDILQNEKNPDLAFVGQGSHRNLMVGVEVLWFRT